jgi:predicted RNase H-like nuclease (RuvC/YqgF family)
MSSVPKVIPMNKRQARQLTDQINAKSGELWNLLKTAHDRKAWDALGYKSWRDYATAEFSVSQSRAYQLLDQARVVTAIQEAANSTNVEISEAVAREIKPVVAKVAQAISDRVRLGDDPVKTTYEVIDAERKTASATAKPEAKPEAKPARPKKGEPTIESLLAENQQLRDELHEARHVAEELAHDLESYNTATAGEIAVAKEIKRLKGMLATVEATRDQWMTTAGELRREVKSMQRKLKAAA